MLIRCNWTLNFTGPWENISTLCLKIWYNHKSEVLTANIFLPLANRITISLDCIYDTGFKICLVRYVSQCLTLNWFYSFQCNLALMFWLTARPCLHISKLNFCSLYMSKGFAEIRHFRKCLDFPQLPRHLQKMLFIWQCSISGKWHSISKKLHQI